VSIGAAYFGESMFSRRRDASKIALAYLIDRLRLAGYRLFDTQFITPHLASLGAREVSRATYHRMLTEALPGDADFAAPGPPPAPDQVLQRMTQTS
jgi:leucyl/phenylalanyl-tRNA--protein transferase